VNEGKKRMERGGRKEGGGGRAREVRKGRGRYRKGATEK